MYCYEEKSFFHLFLELHRGVHVHRLLHLLQRRLQERVRRVLGYDRGDVVVDGGEEVLPQRADLAAFGGVVGGHEGRGLGGIVPEVADVEVGVQAGQDRLELGDVVVIPGRLNEGLLLVCRLIRSASS